MKPKFTGKIKKGKVHLQNKNSFDEYARKFEGKNVEITIDRVQQSRTLKQNSYYWGVVIEILTKEFGYGPDEIHEALKFLFLKKLLNEDLITVKSTTSLTTKEFGEYIEKIKVWASSNHNIYIPDSDEVEWEE
jgi:hypothetical protein